MSGSRHHHIPQFFLRNFCSQKRRKEYYSWHFQRNLDPLENNVKNIGVAHHFYGDSDKNSLDDQITSLESNFSALLNTLNSLPNDTEVNGEELPFFLAHASVRTMHFRKTLESGTCDYLQAFKETLEKKSNIQKMIRSHIYKNRDEFEEFLLQEFMKRNIQGDYSKLFKIVYEKIEADNIIEAVSPQLQKDLSESITGFLATFSQISEEIHQKALRKFIIPPKRVIFFTGFKYKTRSVPPNSLILGDVVGICIQGNSKMKLTGINNYSDSTHTIVLPISHQQVVIGSKGIVSSEPDPMEINYASASCSINFFVSSRNTGLESTLHSKLGENSKIVSSSEIESFINELF